VVRQVLSAVPMFTTVSTRRSREAAGRWALAAYYAAGQTTAIMGWVGSAVLARTLNVPGSTITLAIMIAWAAVTALVATITPKGDYAKARAALRATRPLSTPQV
jgi:small neutral amino acid transporter SnatA (MarC family)